MTHPPSAGVAVARFQVPELHKGHTHLIEYIQERHNDVLIVLGIPRTLPVEYNSLDYDTRKNMVEELFPNVHIEGISDSASNTVWSQKLEEIIKKKFPYQEVILYGSRDSFLEKYTGSYEKHDVPMVEDISGTQIRKKLAQQKQTPDFRAGMQHSVSQQEPISFQTVDTAVIHPGKKEVLLAGKDEDEGKLRFIGGFVEPTDVSLAHAAKREAIEETSHIEIDDITFIDSVRIDDWRYRETQHGIMTAFFCATYIFGAPRPTDDIDHLEWVPYDEVENVIADVHAPLAQMFKKHINT